MCLYEFSNSSYYFFCKIEWIKIGWNCDALHLWMFLQFLCNNFDTVHRIQTKFGMDILLDPRNKPAKEFFIFLKIQDGRRRSKIFDALYFFSSLLGIWIPFIGFSQNLACFSLILTSHRTRELYELLWELQIDVSIIYWFQNWVLFNTF